MGCRDWLAAKSAKSNTKSSQPSVCVDNGLIVNIAESNDGDKSALRSRLILKAHARHVAAKPRRRVVLLAEQLIREHGGRELGGGEGPGGVVNSGPWRRMRQRPLCSTELLPVLTSAPVMKLG